MSLINKLRSLSKMVKIAVIQLSCTNDKESNFKVSKDYIEKAAKSEAKIAFFPEAFDFIGKNKEESLKLSETLEGQTISNFRDLAKKHKIFLSLGGHHRKDALEAEKIYNSHIIISDRGDILAVYDKLHLFDVDIPGGITIMESNLIKLGKNVVHPVNTPVGPVGMAICYDMRFSEMAMKLREQSAKVLTYPSAFTVETGKAHWHILLRARAIETQCFVVAAAQEGKHNDKRSSYGHSIVIDPWGKIVSEKTDPGPGLLLCDIDLNMIDKYRQNLPVFTHRRLDVFPSASFLGSAKEIGDKNYMFGPNIIQAECVFYRSHLSFAFVNISPLVPGHVLISPVRIVERFEQLTPSEIVDIYSVAHTISPKLSEYFSASGLTISQQDGRVAGQSVPVSTNVFHILTL